MNALTDTRPRTAATGRRATKQQTDQWYALRVHLGFDWCGDRLKTSTISEWALGWPPETFRREVWSTADLDIDDMDRVLSAARWIATQTRTADLTDLLAELAATGPP